MEHRATSLLQLSFFVNTEFHMAVRIWDQSERGFKWYFTCLPACRARPVSDS